MEVEKEWEFHERCRWRPHVPQCFNPWSACSHNLCTPLKYPSEPLAPQEGEEGIPFPMKIGRIGPQCEAATGKSQKGYEEHGSWMLPPRYDKKCFLVMPCDVEDGPVHPPSEMIIPRVVPLSKFCPPRVSTRYALTIMNRQVDIRTLG